MGEIKRYSPTAAQDKTASKQPRVRNEESSKLSMQVGRITGTDGQQESMSAFVIFEMTDVPPGATITKATIDWTVGVTVTMDSPGTAYFCVLDADGRWNAPHTQSYNMRGQSFHVVAKAGAVEAVRSDWPAQVGDHAHFKTNEFGRSTYQSTAWSIPLAPPATYTELGAVLTRDGSRGNTQIWLELWRLDSSLINGRPATLVATSDTREFNSLPLQDADYTGGDWTEYEYFTLSGDQQFEHTTALEWFSIRLGGVTWGDDGGAQILCHGKSKEAQDAFSALGTTIAESATAQTHWSPVAYPIDSSLPHLTNNLNNSTRSLAIPYGDVFVRFTGNGFQQGRTFIFGDDDLDTDATPGTFTRLDVLDLKDRINSWVNSANYLTGSRLIAFCWEHEVQATNRLILSGSTDNVPAFRPWTLSVEYEHTPMLAAGEAESEKRYSAGTAESESLMSAGVVESAAKYTNIPIRSDARYQTGEIESEPRYSAGEIEAGEN